MCVPTDYLKSEPTISTNKFVSERGRRYAGTKQTIKHRAVPGKNLLCNLDVLLPTTEQAAKLAESCVNTKFFRFQPEYMGTRRIRVTVCNVTANLSGDVLASYLNAFGRMEEMTQLHATARTVHGDYTFQLYLDREGFQAISDTLYFRDRQMMVVVEGRRSRCRSYKQVGHLAKVNLQRTADLVQRPGQTEINNTTNSTYTTGTIKDTIKTTDAISVTPE